MKNEEPLEVVALVAKGAPGAKGDKGDPGMTPAARRAFAVMLLITLLFNGASLFWQAHNTRATQAAERRAGLLVERKLCQTFAQLSALKPPGPADVKKGQPYPPSFAYDDHLHTTLDQLPADIGINCRRQP